MKILSMLSPYIGSALAVRGLGKLDPTMKKFIGYGAAAGYGTDQILDFLREKMKSEGEKSLFNKLKSSEAEGNLRPDEAATLSRLRKNEKVADIAQGGLSTLGGLAGGAIGAGIVIGNNSENNSNDDLEYPTEEMSTRQLGVPENSQNVRPKGKQPSPLSRAGLQEQNQPGSSAMNGIDKLFSFIESRVSKGEPLQKAVSTARANTAFKPIIAAAEQETGMPFIDIVKSRFSGYGQPEQQQSQGGDKTALLAELRQLGQFFNGIGNRK